MRNISRLKREIIYWGILFILLFLFEAFERHHSHFEWNQFFFILLYCFASIFISYVLIPQFLYKKKILKFSLSIGVTFVMVGLIEELILEKLFSEYEVAVHFNMFSAFVSMLPPILIFTGFKFAWDALEKENKIEKLSRVAAENELLFLNSQINPHFLFNNLNNLYASALENSPHTPHIILQLSSILRYMLYDCRKPCVALSSEVENLEKFIGLYRLQLGSDSEIIFDVQGVNRHLQIAPLIIIVFVENAFKHSQSSQTSAIKINIALRVEDNTLKFTCENTYGEEANTQDLAKGIGLANVKNKLRLVYPDSHRLEISRNEGWYKVFLEIEL
ncbi:MAG: histidine kinase [Carboxylicivirga sp.]|jgi:hypothetical protein|nr:histidine kinase [Carboxylicivirga sp.]